MIALALLADAIFSGRPTSRIRLDPSAAPSLLVSARDVGLVLSPPEALDKIEAAADPSLDAARLQPGDVVITARGSLRAAVAGLEHRDAIPGPNLIVVRPRPEIPGAVIAAYLRLPSVQARLQAAAYGTATVHFGVEDVKKLTMKLPPADDLKGLAETVALTDRYVAAATRAIEARRQIALERLRDALEPESAA